MPDIKTRTYPKLKHEEFCLPQSARGDGDATEPRIEQYRLTGDDGKGNERTYLVTRCQECGATHYELIKEKGHG